MIYNDDLNRSRKHIVKIFYQRYQVYNFVNNVNEIAICPKIIKAILITK